MRAFHSDPAIKKKYIERVRAHRLADNLIKGTGWEDGKGCAVGCTLEAYEHRRYEIELGIPEWLALVEDRLFEGLPMKLAMQWPERFLEAIHPGANLDAARGPFIQHVLETTLGNFDNEKFPDTVQAVRQSQALWARNDFGTASWNSAASAARSAAASAEDAARSAAASAEDAARSAAASVAWSAAASAAWSAAASVAWSAAYSGFADKLIELLEQCVPIQEIT